MVKLDNKVHQCITTLFDTQYTVWGDNNATAYAHSGWEEFDVGRYEFPFVLKFPNVNYPPSIEDPPGFNVRYMWTAYMEGPGGQSGISSKCINTPYRPIIAAPADKEWTYRTTLVRDPGIHMGNSKKQHAIAQVLAKLNKQCYCPDEPFSMELTLTTLQSDLKIIQGSFKFRKHHQGKLIVSGGTAQRYVIRDLSHGNIPPPSLASSSSPDTGGFMKKQIISFAIPTRNVSPTFTSRHIRIYYDLHFTITLEESHFLKRHTIQCEFSIPLNIANLPNNELIRVPDLMTIQSYQHQSNNIKYPEFFDPGQTNDTTMTDPPSYYTSSFQRQQQQQRTIYLTCPSSPSYITIPGKSNGNKTPPTTTTLTNSSSHHGSSVTVGCSSTTTTTPNHSHHQRHHSFPDVGEATLIYGIYNEN
ncbi:hypothetical protein BDA99DRAFT_114905 [Phascolomyces articulosus]|uniref:Arrestin C-terminal-like domain-containing protein n=1 Tax=Phascolomyces articulosus TaxID=60185 RepID=A0AAD5PIX6_9FUNG|nr:hypothetical protein BDA99DRAFT_114905 [Phascolomyces articulosus]